MRAADFAALTSLFEATDAVEHERRTARDAALAEAERCREEMQSTLDAEREAAAQARESGYREGFERGLEDAAAHWADAALRNAAAAQSAAERQSERLGNIVAMAVEKVIEQADRSTLYLRAVRTISKLMKDVPLLTLRVPECDHDSAQRAVDALLAHVGSSVPIEVIADTGLLAGSCLFESDQGVVDAGLATQLAAIKRAVVRAARQAARAPGDLENSEDDLPDGASPNDDWLRNGATGEPVEAAAIQESLTDN